MSLSEKSAIVLGATGNIGRLLVSELQTKNYRITATGRTKPNFTGTNIENKAIDYALQDELTEAVAGHALCFMMVGLPYKAKLWEQEWPGLITRVIQACKTNNVKLVFVDNVYAYGPVMGPMTEETPMLTKTRKGRVRKQVDEIILQATQHEGLNAIIAKSADFYGPRMTTSIVGERFFEQIKKGKIEWFGNPNAIHTYTFAPDIARAVVVLAESNFQGNIHLPTTQPGINAYKMQKIIENVSGTKLSISPFSKTMAFVLQIFMPVLGEFVEMFYQYEHDYIFDSTKFNILFPDFVTTSYQDGFTETYKSFTSNEPAS